MIYKVIYEKKDFIILQTKIQYLTVGRSVGYRRTPVIYTYSKMYC